METLGARIKRLRDKVGLTQEGLAKRVEVSKNTVLNWEKDRREPRSSEVEALADALCVPVSELLPTSEASILVQPTTRPVCPITIGEEPVWIPIVEPHVCAGGGNGYCEIDWEPVGRYPFIPADFMGIAWHSGTLRIIRVDGNSMEPRYRDGDMIIFSEESVESGDTIIALWDGRLFLRGYIEDKRNRSYRLKALNPDYADIVIDIEDERFQSLGKVVAKVNKLEFDRGFW